MNAGSQQKKTQYTPPKLSLDLSILTTMVRNTDIYCMLLQFSK